MNTGTVKTVLADKGFGFIGVEGRDKDLFFHSRELAEGVVFDASLEGKTVSFEIGEGEKGPFATKVNLA